MNPIRNLRPDEVELRISKVHGKGFELLAYKNSRTDQNILDEVYGWDGWKREHKEINGSVYCGISIWSEKRNEWITKWDCGSESFSDKEKGAASDSFKRAAVNFGIGRELYSAPSIQIWDSSYTKKNHKDKDVIYEEFEVTEMKVEDNKIVAFAIADSKGKQIFSWYEGKQKVKPTSTTTSKTTASKVETTTTITVKPKSNYRENLEYLNNNHDKHLNYIGGKLKQFKKSELKWCNTDQLEEIVQGIKKETEPNKGSLPKGYDVRTQEEIDAAIPEEGKKIMKKWDKIHEEEAKKKRKGVKPFPGAKEKEAILSLVKMGEPYKTMFNKLLKYYKVDNVTKLDVPQAQAAFKKMQTVAS